MRSPAGALWDKFMSAGLGCRSMDWRAFAAKLVRATYIDWLTPGGQFPEASQTRAIRCVLSQGIGLQWRMDSSQTFSSRRLFLPHFIDSGELRIGCPIA